MKLFYFVVILALIFSIFANSSFASEEFQTFYYFTYTVGEDASVLVDQEIRLKNRLANIFVSEYALTVGSNRVSHIAAWDNFGPLEPQIEVGSNRTRILVKFTQEVVGKDKEIPLHIQYKTSDFANINGQILEINIPDLAKKSQLDDYQVKLVVPSRFGPPSFLQPKPTSKTSSAWQTIYQFAKDRLLKVQGISAAFGETQIYDFTLFYPLKNSNNFRVWTEIALPADTAFQRVYYQDIQPTPSEIKIDEDDNWLAVYKLNPQEEFTVIASGSAEVYIRVKEELKGDPLGQKELEKFLLPDQYWEVDNPEIKKLADQLKTPKDIYDYVVKNLIYDYGRLEGSVQRLGAAATLTHKESALCAEFTDLFVALARAAGIPAREVDGYAYTTNPKLRPLSLSQDILHAWPEFYDERKNLWIAVDPTWENTTGGVDFFQKLDLNHFAFVRHGVKSNYPLPPGAYNDDQGKKSVFVKFGQKKTPQVGFEFKAKLPSKIIAGLPLKGEILIINTGQSAYHKKKVTLKTGELEEFEVDVLPPKASYKVPIFVSTVWSRTKTYNIQVGFGEEDIGYQVQVLPFYQYFWLEIKIWFQKLFKH